MQIRSMSLVTMLAMMLVWLLAACDSNAPVTIPPPTAPASPAVTLAPTPTSQPTIQPTNLPTTAPAPAPTRTGFNMRAVDWFKVVTTDPNLKYDPTVPTLLKNAPYVQLKSNTQIRGFAMLDGITFLDMSGDGQEEAVISIFSGGTAGNLGLLVYTVANNAPILADSLPGYKIGGVVDGNLLKVTEPIYQGWEPNCCPSGLFETRYRLQANKLVQVSRNEVPIPEARKMTVEKYYELLQNKNYADAWNNFLSPDYRSARSYDSWVAGYANTVSFTFTTSDLPDGRVKVDLTSTDKTTTGTVQKKFTGTWTLIWYSTARFKQWVLDKGQFTEVK